MLRPSYFLGQSVLTALLLACASLQAAELPAPLAASLAQIAPTATPGEVTPFEDAGETLYSVEVQTPGSPGAREWYFDSKGIPVGVQAFEKELPPALLESLSLHQSEEESTAAAASGRPSLRLAARRRGPGLLKLQTGILEPGNPPALWRQAS